VSVYERKDSKHWWMHVEHAPAGQRKRSTKIAKGFTATERKASRVEAEKVYHAACILAGQVLGGTAPPPKAPRVTLAVFVRDVYEDALASHRGQDREREIVNRLVRDLGQLALEDITPDVVKAWRKTRRTTATKIEHFGGPKGKRHTFPLPSARTVNNEVGVLKQILNAAVPTYLPASPIRGLPNLKTVTPKRHVLTDDEERRIASVLDPIDYAIILIGLDTLARPGDAIDLRRPDDHGDVLYIRDPKNGTPHEVPVSTRLRKALDAVPVDAKQPEWYFPSRRIAKSERTRSATLAKALRRACEKTGVPYGRKVDGVTLHWATRRTGATRMIRKGGDKVLGVVQRIGNWKTLAVLVEIYQNVNTAEMKAAVESVSPKGRLALVQRKAARPVTPRLRRRA
jgi:integrase